MKWNTEQGQTGKDEFHFALVSLLVRYKFSTHIPLQVTENY